MKSAAKGSCALVVAAALACAGSPKTTRRSWPTMGTYATVAVASADPARAEAAVGTVRAVFDRVNATMSNWSPDSELSRLNREAGRGAYRIEDPALAACIEAALEGARRTDGAFDPTVGPLMTAWGFRPKAPRVPSDEEIAAALAKVGPARVAYDAAERTIRFDRDGVEIDLGGIAKGCALDEARRAVESDASLLDVELDLGGQWAFLRGRGRAVGIADPSDRARVLGEVEVGPAESIATTSASENHFTIGGVRYGHVMDPATGRPTTTDVVQATVIDGSATTVEILGKALMVGGSRRAAEILRRFPTASAVLVVDEGGRRAVLASASLEGRLAVDDPRFVLPLATMPASP